MGFDIGIVVLYIAILVGMGIYGGRKVKGAADFTASDRTYGSVVIFMSLAASYIGGGFSAGNAAESFANGIGMTVILWGFSIATIWTGKVLVKGIGRFRGICSTGGIMAAAYGPAAGVFTGIFGFCTCAAVVAAQMHAMGIVLHRLLGISATAGVLIGCGVVLVYSTVGGLQSVIAADMVQFALLAVGVPIVLFAALHRAGGLDAVLYNTPPTFFNPLNGKTLPQFLSSVITIAAGEMLVPPYTQRLLIGKNPKATARGTIMGGVFSIPFFAMTCLLGLSARVLGVTDVASDAMPALILNVLPIGLRGLVMAAMVSIMLSAADGFLNGAAVSLVEDVVCAQKPHLTDRTKLRLLRAVNLLTGVIAVGVALYLPNIFSILSLSYTFWAPIILIPLAAAFYGVQTTPRAFWRGAVAGLVATALWELTLARVTGVAGAPVGMLANALLFFTAGGESLCRVSRQRYKTTKTRRDL